MLRLFSSVTRRFSTDDCTPLSAPTAAHGEGAAGPEVCCDWIVAMASISGLLATAHPIRKPVMAYIFDTPLMTMTFDSSSGDFMKSPLEESKVIVINGVSKMYAMTGFRIGWAVASKPLIEAMATIQSQQTSG